MKRLLVKAPESCPLHPPPLNRGCRRERRGYNRTGSTVPLNLDTPCDIERMQIEGWRRMSAQEKAALVTGLTRAAFAMTLAGIRHRYPAAPPREQHLRLALITLGPDLARRAFPEIDALNPR